MIIASKTENYQLLGGVLEPDPEELGYYQGRPVRGVVRQ